jgi:hypothetical protein
MTSRARHGLFLAGAIPTMFCAGLAILALRDDLHQSQVEALLWASFSSGTHGILGWILWAGNSPEKDARITSGLMVLALRFSLGAGLFMTAIVMMPGQRTLLASAWAGMFLVLQISESIFFFHGVQEL